MTHRSKPTRRDFLKHSRAAAIAASVAGLAPPSALGANDRLRIGVIGCGERGRNALMQEVISLSGSENVIIAAVCDVWRQQREQAAQMVKDHWGAEPRSFEDYRDLLALDDIDAVIIASPEHQHTAQLIAAAEAGKDAYCEKPLAMDMESLKKAVDTVKRENRVVQIGTQLRSYPSFTGCKKVVREGALGKIIKVMQVRNSYRPYWHRYKRELAEADTNWKGFLADLPQRPFDDDRHTAWYGYVDYSLGAIASLMAHYIDLVHYITGAKFPASAVAMGGIYAWDDQRDSPDSVHALLDYPEGFMVSYCTVFGNGAGSYTRFLGKKGMIDATDWRAPFMTGEGSEHPDRIKEKQPVPDVEIPQHMENWLQCLRTREKPNADIDAGYQHAVACILANEAMRNNRRMAYDREKREIYPM